MCTRAVMEGMLQSSPLLYDGKKEVRTMRSSVSILDHQQWRTILCEKPASVHIIE